MPRHSTRRPGMKAAPRLSMILVALWACPLAAYGQDNPTAAARGAGEAGPPATAPRGPGRMTVPRPGPVPLPILPALPARDDAAFYANADVPHGRVDQATYKNPAGQGKRMHVYLPPGYDKDADARYPVLYLNHGGGDDDSKWTSTGRDGGHAQFILDNLIAAGKARPMIVVMPNTRALASPEPPKPGEDDACSKEFLKDIIPYVEAHYHAKPGRENRALAGLSMGGFVVMNTGLAHLDTFGELYVYSSGYFPDRLKAFDDSFKPVLTDPKTNQELLRVPLYMAAGETDIALLNSQRTLAILNNYGVRNFWVLSSGGHDWNNWRRYLYQTAQIMFAAPPGGSGGASPSTAVAGATGKWQAEFDTQVGRQKYTYEFKADGGKLAGKATGQIGDDKREPVEIKDGKVEGDRISFTEPLEFNGNSVEITYTGKVAGDVIRFTRMVGDFATEELVAKRVKTDRPAEK